VAIVQVSRITQRTGLEQDLPQPLAGAEFGWAIDQRKLYIGNGTIADGAPIVGTFLVLLQHTLTKVKQLATQYRQVPRLVILSVKAYKADWTVMLL